MGEKALFSMIRDLEGAVERGLKQSRRRQPVSAAQILDFAAPNRPYLEKLMHEAEAIYPVIPAERQPFFIAHLMTPIRIHLGALKLMEAYGQAVEALDRSDMERAAALARQALAAAESIIEATHKAEYGKWARWYGGNPSSAWRRCAIRCGPS